MALVSLLLYTHRVDAPWVVLPDPTQDVCAQEGEGVEDGIESGMNPADPPRNGSTSLTTGWRRQRDPLHRHFTRRKQLA